MKRIAIVLFTLLSVVLTACGSSSPTQTATTTPSQVPSATYSSPKPTSSPRPASTPKPTESLTANDIIKMLDSECKSSLGSAYYGYSKESGNGNNLLILNVCSDGACYDYLSDSSGWKALKDSADSLSSECRRLFKNNGYSDWHVAIYLLNDLDTDRVLYISLDGSEYDY